MASRTGKNRGRPPLPAGRAKRAPLSFRTTAEVRSKMDRAASESGRSLAQEIEYRLERSVHLDRWSNTDLLVSAGATSSSNACVVGCAQILREAIEKSGYAWQQKADNLPEAIMAIFTETGRRAEDEATGLTFAELDLLAAVDSILSP